MLQCYVVAAATPTAFRDDESKESRGSAAHVDDGTGTKKMGEARMAL